VISKAEGKKKSPTEGPTYEGNPVFPCASCRNNVIKVFKASAAVYDVLLAFW